MERNLLFTDPIGARDALPAGHWNTPEKKALVFAICRHILYLAPRATTLDVSRYCNLTLTCQRRIGEELGPADAHEIFEMRRQLLDLWRRFTLPAAHNNANQHAQ
jgi:hypothetical protein